MWEGTRAWHVRCFCLQYGSRDGGLLVMHPTSLDNPTDQVCQINIRLETRGGTDTSGRHVDSHTGKRFLDIHHLPRTRLHKPAPVPSRVLQPVARPHRPALLQIALVPCHDLDRRWHPHVNPLRAGPQFAKEPFVVFLPLVGLHVDQLHEIVQRPQAVWVGDIVDEEEGIRFQCRCRP